MIELREASVADEQDKTLKVGDKIPLFLVKDHKGLNVTDEDVIGTPLVIYFYPKDGTPTCTKEACAFRDQMAVFDEMQALILGVSPDGAASHKAFIKEQKIEFPLLSDEKKEMFRSFGLLEDDHVIRATFVVNSEGIIQWIEKPVDVPGHIERVIEALKKYCGDEVVSFDDYDSDYKEFMGKTLGQAPDEKTIRKEILEKYNLKESDLKRKE